MGTLLTLRCHHCGHDWTPRTAEPRVCPRCKCYEWDREHQHRTYARATERLEAEETA